MRDSGMLMEQISSFSTSCWYCTFHSSARARGWFDPEFKSETMVDVKASLTFWELIESNA